MIRATLRRPLLASSVVPTALVGLGVIGIGVAAAITNPRTFSIGVGAMLAGYGILLLVLAWLVASGKRWALGLLVASSLLHALVLGSFAVTAVEQQDWVPLTVSLAVGALVLVSLVASVLALARGEFDQFSK